MNLQDRIDEVKALTGYVFSRKRADDHAGHVQAYSFWFEKDGVTAVYEVRFLVVLLGQPEEWAKCYGVGHIPQPKVTYKSVVDTALVSFIANNESYEKGWIVSCDEVNEIAIIGAYEIANGVATVKTAVVYKIDGNLTVRLLG